MQDLGAPTDLVTIITSASAHGAPTDTRGYPGRSVSATSPATWHRGGPNVSHASYGGTNPANSRY